jgi:UDP:flavonoid glycosyltransferase YjiC (YdhE family)
MVRVLLSFEGGNGHFEPLMPIARAAEQAGHSVAFACAPERIASIAAAGFRVFAAGVNVGGTPETAAMEARYAAIPVIAEREALLLREGFAGHYARHKAADLLAVCAEWQPDLLVREEVDFGAAIAAERLGLLHATVLVLAAGSFVRSELVVGPLNALRAEYGLLPDPELSMLSRYLVLSPFPPSFRDPAFPLPPTAHAFRPLATDVGDSEQPLPWAVDASGVPTVYFTLGTAVGSRARDLFGRVIAGLRDLPIQLIVTVGRRFEPADFGEQPAHVHIEQYIPQSLLLPHCDLVVSHGGSGTVMGALAHGVPLALIPLNADQPLNADRCAALGVGRVIGTRDEITPELVREAVAAMLANPAYRRNAERVRDEIAALPGPEYALALLERLVREKRPLVGG